MRAQPLADFTWAKRVQSARRDMLKRFNLSRILQQRDIARGAKRQSHQFKVEEDEDFETGCKDGSSGVNSATPKPPKWLTHTAP